MNVIIVVVVTMVIVDVILLPFSEEGSINSTLEEKLFSFDPSLKLEESSVLAKSLMEDADGHIAFITCSW